MHSGCRDNIAKTAAKTVKYTTLVEFIRLLSKMPAPSRTPSPCGLFRRLFAIGYDLFLLTALMFIVTAIANALNHGESITPQNPCYPLYVVTLLAVSFYYFFWFWRHGGQTLGMKTWKIKLVSFDGQTPDGRALLIRYCVAILSWLPVGLGFFWALFDAEKRGWHDLASKTVLIDLRR